MGKKMSDAPVYFVLGQVRFNALLTLESYVPTIQDSLRKVGYADFAKATIATINLNIGVQVAVNQVPVAQIPRYQFLNQAKTAGFILTQSALSFETTEYHTFEPFRDALLLGLKTIDEATGGLSFSERIGIRFLDAVCPRPNENLSDYLAPSLIGLSDKLNGRKLTRAVSETWSALDKTNLMCRVVIHDQAAKGPGFPPDLHPEAVIFQISEKFRNITGLYAIIDTDSWHEERQKFSIDKIKEILGGLHATTRRSFDDMVTPHALMVWE